MDRIGRENMRLLLYLVASLLGMGAMYSLVIYSIIAIFLR